MSGQYLRRMSPEPGHSCSMPDERSNEAGDIWECDCGRAYVWSSARGYGFEWCRVYLRKWWYRLVRPGGVSGGGGW